MAVRRPSRLVRVVRFVTPSGPTVAKSAREKFEVRSRAARLDQLVLLVWLAAMLALSRGDVVHLASPCCERSRVLAFNTEKQQLGDVTEVEPDATTVRTSVFA